MSARRLAFLQILPFFFSLVILSRLFYWQVLKHEQFSILARSQVETTVFVGAERGKILAADGSILVSNQKAYLVYAVLPEIKKLKKNNETDDELVEKIANQLTPILLEEKLFGKEKVSATEKDLAREAIRDNITSQLRLPNLVWVPIAREVGEEAKQKIEKLAIKGIGFEADTKRFYPEGNLAANLLGFVGKDEAGSDKGYFGLEGYYDSKLRGRSGRLIQEIDALGKPILAADPEEVESLNGADLITTLDRTVQFVIERKLKEGVEKYGAKSGAVVVMDPKSGAILGSASYPSFDLADPAGSPVETYKNFGISQIYEPGSTFKAITFSAALDSEAIDSHTICPCEGPMKAGEYEIRTWNNRYFPNSTIADILQHSDNVGAGFAASKMGTETFLRYIREFGFGEKTKIDLEGEEDGIIKERKNWSEVDLITASFGQGLSVTPLQMVRAIAAIANNGKLMRPYVVKKLAGPKNEVEFAPKEIRQVIKPSTAEQMKQLLLEAVEGGEGKKWIPLGYRVAGKTGTAQVAIGGQYSPSKAVASFVGFGPVEDPKFAMIVVLFEPSASIWAVETAEPLFFQIVKELYPYWGVSVSK